MTSLEQLSKDVEEIKKRNAGVEEDKRWETSGTRKTLLIVFTYLSVGLYMNAVGIPDPWTNAIVPAVGFFLSTLTLPFFRGLWRRYSSHRTSS